MRQEYVGGWCDGNRAALKVDGLTITGTMPRNPALAPDLYPDHFSMIADGKCCEPAPADYIPGPRVTDRQLASREYLEARNGLRKTIGKPPLAEPVTALRQ